MYLNNTKNYIYYIIKKKNYPKKLYSIFDIWFSTVRNIDKYLLPTCNSYKQYLVMYSSLILYKS